MESILFMPDELYIYNLNHSYKMRKSNRREIVKKIQDTIYTYYILYNSTKEFEIKNKKEYGKISAMRMIEKLTLLISELTKTHISKRKFDIILNNIITDKRVVEIYKVLEDEDIETICNEIKDIDKRTIKNCELLIGKKLKTLYNYNKLHILKFSRN